MEVISKGKEWSTYLKPKTIAESDNEVYTNHALRLLYEKQLLPTLHKAISDTTLSCYSYIYKKNKASHSPELRSNQAICDWIDHFSNDFVEVLKSIIMQAKNWYLRDKFWIDIKANGTNQSDNKIQDGTLIQSECSPIKELSNQKYSHIVASPGSVFNEPISTSAAERGQSQK